MRPNPLLVALLALAACPAAAPQWKKPGAGASAVDEAMQGCRVQSSLSPPQHVGTPTPRPGGTSAIDRIEDRQSREARQFQKCMQDKGFSIDR